MIKTCNYMQQIKKNQHLTLECEHELLRYPRLEHRGNTKQTQPRARLHDRVAYALLRTLSEAGTGQKRALNWLLVDDAGWRDAAIVSRLSLVMLEFPSASLILHDYSWGHFQGSGLVQVIYTWCTWIQWTCLSLGKTDHSGYPGGLASHFGQFLLR